MDVLKPPVHSSQPHPSHPALSSDTALTRNTCSLNRCYEPGSRKKAVYKNILHNYGRCGEGSLLQNKVIFALCGFLLSILQGLFICPRNKMAPVGLCRMKNRKGLSTINQGGDDLAIRIAVVAAEALVPSSLTSIFAFCKM